MDFGHAAGSDEDNAATLKHTSQQLARMLVSAICNGSMTFSPFFYYCKNNVQERKRHTHTQVLIIAQANILCYSQKTITLHYVNIINSSININIVG